MKRKITILLAILLLLCVSGCKKETDALRFKKEYEALNGKKDSEGVSYLQIEINGNNTVRYCDYEKIVEAIDNGTHLVYLGWPHCPWCRSMLPVLIEAVNEYKGVYIYYFSVYDLRSSYEKDSESSDGQKYKRIADMLKEQATSFYDDGTAKLTASNVYFIREGELIAVHNRTVSSHLDPYEPLMDYQKKELKDEFSVLLEELVKDIPIGCLDDC
ncbi:MAG: hypothetical protein IJM15_06955 [Erysipelotrichaceae bacterium]|nr:hypothetical protein [Erysipelotrichaceae bacterium]